MISIKKLTLLDFSFAKKKWFIIAVSSVLVLLVIALVWGLSVRGTMLDQAVLRVKTKLKTDYQLRLELDKYEFAGLTTVDLYKIKLSPDSGEQLAAVDQFKVSVKLLPLIFGRISLGDMEIVQADITLVKENDSTANYDFLFGKKTSAPKNQVSDSRTLSERVDQVLKQVFEKIPDNLSMKNLSLTYRDSLSKQTINIPEGEIDGGSYDINVFLNQQKGKWNFQGKINAKKQTLSVKISSADKDTFVPFIDHKYGLKVRFDELSFHLDQVAKKGKEALEIKGGMSAKNLRIFHDRLSEEEIVLPEGSADGGLLISENTLELLKETKAQVKDFVFQPQLKFSKVKGKVLDLAVHTGKFKAQDFFNAIPVGLFENLEGIQVEGEIQYDMDFQVDFDKPDSMKFVSKINDRELKVTRWGKADIGALSGPFVYQAYEDTLKMRDILLTQANPKFTPLDRISPILKKTVLNTEDPFFYEHNGFELEAFQLSIITNLKEKKFKRGASTISMQLVKNLFLNRNKTMMRKLEEILLVWLMEQSEQVSKDRLFEIYLNIIEWGKNVYGISEAASYYFGKKPTELTIGESLYLSSIIPRPKTGLSSFEYTGHLKGWVLRHFNTYGSIMSKRNQLQTEDVPASYGFYQVQLQPTLRPPRPKGVVDSMMNHEEIKNRMDEIDQQESLRKALIERLLGRSGESENE